MGHGLTTKDILQNNYCMISHKIVNEVLLRGLVVGEGHARFVFLSVKGQNITFRRPLVPAIRERSKESHVRATMGWRCCCLGRHGPAAERDVKS
jgi:hypothetical protein